MALPAPNLDDRRFQDLVDDAKRLVQQRCPEWTDHNVSDPGVTLIETFAYVVDQLLYRLNRVPERHYVKFLELIGVRLYPPTAARADVTFWLSAPQPATVAVPARTQVSTVRTEADEAVVFSTVAPLSVVACSRARVASATQGRVVERTDELDAGGGFFCFDSPPRPGDALLVGLSDPVPSCAVALRFDCRVEGAGVDPRHPPLAWEAWALGGWVPCEVDRDGTGGLNRAGDVVLHVPRSHAASVVEGRRAGWLRCRVVEPAPGQPSYSASPRILRLDAFSVGGSAEAVHAEIVDAEVIGLSEGVAAQRFALARAPVVPSDEPVVLEVAAGGEGWQEWAQRDDFAASGPDDRHFVLDAPTGEVVLGPAVREADGTLRQHGAVPPKGAPLRVRSYRSGGGQAGNVARGAVRVLKSSIPYVARVENRRPAAGGVDGEDVESAKARGPILLRTRARAVTAEDYEQLAREAAPDVARVRCVGAGEGAEAGGVRVLVVPGAPDEAGRLALEALVPPDECLAAIARHLEERKVIGARVVVEPPQYRGVTVVAQVRARPRTAPERLRSDALEALYRYFSPVGGGPDGEGWPFGRPVQAGEVYAVLQRLRGVEFVEDARLFAADPLTGARGDPVGRIDLERHALVYSYGHQVRVTPG